MIEQTYLQLLNDIAQALKDKKLLLFIGAGVPASIGLPTWGGLISEMANKLGFDKELFNLHGDNLSLAEYYRIEKNGFEELRQWMLKKWDVTDELIQNSSIYSNIANLGCSIIYTTNYDHTLETAFRVNNKQATAIIDVADILKVQADDTQIIKFHGDMEFGSSIVLAEKDYFDRLDFESTLDIKLRADMLGKSILFIGYSLSDINIRLLIYKLNKMWEKSHNAGTQPKSYIFLATPNPVQEAIFRERKIIPIVGNNPDRKLGLEKFLAELVEITQNKPSK